MTTTDKTEPGIPLPADASSTDPTGSGRRPTGDVAANVVLGAGAIVAALLFWLAAHASEPWLIERFGNVANPVWMMNGYWVDYFRSGKIRTTLQLAAIMIATLSAGWWLVPHLPAVRRRLPWLDHPLAPTVALPIVALALGALIIVFGNRHFGATDMILGIELAWRQSIGQRPYSDFIATVPVGFMLGARWAFDLFGAHFAALTKLTALFAIGTFAWTYLVLRRVLAGRPWLALGAATALEIFAVLLASFWWYNPITNVAAILYVLNVLALLRRPCPRRWLFSYAASLLLLAAMKPNIAALLIVGATIVLLTVRDLRLPVIVASAAAFAAFCGILAASGLSLVELLASYLSIADRALPYGKVFANIPVLDLWPMFIALALALSPLVLGLKVFLNWRGFDGGQPDRRPTWVLALSLLVAAAAFAAHGELKWLDMPFYFLPPLIVFGTTGARVDWLGRWTAAVALSLACATVYLGSTRLRVERIGFGAFFEWDALAQPMRQPFFSGLHASERFQRLLDEIELALAIAGPNARVYFGPRLEFAYAAFNRPSPRGIPPMLWHGGTIHPKGDEPKILDALRKADLEVIVWLRSDPEPTDAGFARYVYQEFAAPGNPNWQLREITMLTRKPR